LFHFFVRCGETCFFITYWIGSSKSPGSDMRFFDMKLLRTRHLICCPVALSSKEPHRTITMRGNYKILWCELCFHCTRLYAPAYCPSRTSNKKILRLRLRRWLVASAPRSVERLSDPGAQMTAALCRFTLNSSDRARRAFLAKLCALVIQGRIHEKGG
jgi:hypothetical protein